MVLHTPHRASDDCFRGRQVWLAIACKHFPASAIRYTEAVWMLRARHDSETVIMGALASI